MSEQQLFNGLKLWIMLSVGMLIGMGLYSWIDYLK
jgi:hypothetical protein